MNIQLPLKVNQAVKKINLKILPSHIKPEKFIEVCTTAALVNPDLSNCTDDSLAQSFLMAAKDGLLPDGREAAVIAYSKKQGNNWIKVAQYQPMIDGILKRLRMSGEVSIISAKPVYEADSFSYWMNIEGENLEYKPDFFAEDRGEIKAVFAWAKLAKGNEKIVEVMTRADVDKIMRLSKTAIDKDGKVKPYSVWGQHYERMALKTVLHRIAKRLPNSSEVMEMLERGIQIKTFKEQAINKVQEPPKETINDKKRALIADMAKATNSDIPNMLAWISSKTGNQVNTISNLNETQYLILIDMLEKKQQKQKNNLN